jgi:hypothetical protein
VNTKLLKVLKLIRRGRKLRNRRKIKIKGEGDIKRRKMSVGRREKIKKHKGRGS